MNKGKRIWSSMISAAMVASTVAMPAANVMAASSNFNYAEALQKGIMFYEFQKSGDLPDNQRNNWRGDSCLEDGADAGLDLTGGWFDAGDNVKFNLPMSYTSTMLAWSYLEDEDIYKASGEDEFLLDEIKWANDYFIKCNPDANTYYFQVGDGNADHAFWGAAEILQMDRPSYKVTVGQPGSAVAGETAASLAACAMVFEDIDPAYSAECLAHAKQLYALAEAMGGDTYYDSIAGSFYKSWSGYNDELAWAGTWLYKATGDEKYLAKAETAAAKFGPEDQGGTEVAYTWGHNWDDVHLGASLLLAQITDKDAYKTNIENHLDYWATDHNGKSITRTPKGLAWLTEWGPLRYAATVGFMASVYADWDGCSAQKAEEYKTFAKTQADYMLGSTGRSFVVGFGENAPERPHHRTAHGGWENNLNGEPKQHRHTLVGALVGGPNSSDGYNDVITDYVANEVACDYNAGFVGLMAKMYKQYGGTLVENLNAIEEVGEEIFLEAGINAQDNTNAINFVEFKFMLRNHTAWPARVTDKLTYRIFLDLSDVIAKGYTADQMTAQANYKQYSGTKVSKVLPLDEENNIYYVDVDLTGAKIYPGGQSESRNEVQLRIAAPCKWDYTKSYSYQGLAGSSSSNMVRATNIAVYDDGKLVYGSEAVPSAPQYAPVVSLVTPKDGDVYDFSDGNISAIKLAANATVQDSTVKSVTFYVNGKATETVVPTGDMAETQLTVPDFSTAKDGVETYTIKAVATAENGKKTESETATITVKLPVKEAPTVVITEPKDGDVIDFSKGSDEITVKADATVKGSTIDKVEFFVNGESIGEATTDYAATFKPAGYADKAGVANEYVLTATATAANGTVTTSEPVTIKVQLPEKPAPVVEIITPDAGEKFEEETTTVQVVATADIAEGNVDKVIFYADGKAFATVDNTVDGVYTASYTVEGTVTEMGILTPVVFTAVAVSDLGAETTSEAVSVEIQKPVKAAPVVSFDLGIANSSNGGTNTNTITNNFVISHLGGDEVDLSKLSLRYFFTKDGTADQTVWVDNAAAQMNYDPWYVSYTGKIQGKAVTMTAPTEDADSYIEILFNGTDTLKSGAQLTIATRTAKNDWSNYDQTNDFSYGDSNKIAVYYDGELIAGMEP